jgi:hypothetical protein
MKTSTHSAAVPIFPKKIRVHIITLNDDIHESHSFEQYIIEDTVIFVVMLYSY